MGLSALVVDDSVIYRKAIVKILEGSGSVSLVRQASNGKEALRMFQENPSDLVTLDIEMPLMTGLEALPLLIQIKPDVKVLMVSSLTVKAATVTMECLNLGATDFITKEQAFGLRDDQEAALGVNLRDKLALMMSICKKDIISRMSALELPTSSSKTILPLDERAHSSPSISRFQSKKSAISLLLVGSSTGGPQTLQEVFKQMQSHRNYGVVVVQHMPPVFTAQLAQNLQKVTGHLFVEASEGLIVEKNMIVIAKGGFHLELIKDQGHWLCHLTQTEPVNSCRPSVDVTFKSVAQQIHSSEVIAVMLTGMGADGAQGCKALSEKGVCIITQEKSSCIVYGMPKAVDDLGIATSHAKPTFIIPEIEKFMLSPQLS